MVDLITLLEITEIYGCSRSTIIRRIKAENIKVHRKLNKVGAGAPKKAITKEDLIKVINFNPETAKNKGIYQDFDQKAKTARKRPSPGNKFGKSDNRKNRRYMTIQPYTMLNGFQRAVI